MKIKYMFFMRNVRQVKLCVCCNLVFWTKQKIVW